MVECLKKESNVTRTENGAVTYATTNSDCLDLFATIGALRYAPEDEIVIRFMLAYAEDATIAMKLLFFARDIRGGLGERRVFRIILNWLANNEAETVKKNLAYIAEFGRFDDMLALLDTPCETEMLACLKAQFDEDVAHMAVKEPVSLLAKWLPSINTSSRTTVRNAKKNAKTFGLSEASYRKTLSALRAQLHIIENNLRQKDYTFEYEKQPSRAMFKYRKAFYRNDEERYMDYISKVSNGTKTLHADNVAPYELVKPYLQNNWDWDAPCYLKDMTEEEKKILNATWDSLPDYGGEDNALVVIDTSGSMYWGVDSYPASVALSLGLYFAKRNRGRFHNHVIEFSETPRFIETKGATFVDQLRYLTSFSEVADTNLEAVFDLVLSTAVKYDVPQEEMPAKLIIISDMEFNECVNHASISNFENAKASYEINGYQLPQIVFWNVASRNRQQPVTKNEQGIALISGVTPRLFDMVAGDLVSPYACMMEVLESERYAKIVA